MRFPALAAIGLAVALLASPTPARSQGPQVAVLIDFGDGSFAWSDVSLPPGSTAFNATVSAAEARGFALNVSYFDGQPFVADIADRHPVYPDYWHLFLWEDAGWSAADVGADSINATSGDAYAWFLARDDECCGFPAPGPVPLPTPAHRFPSTAFRGSLANLGLASGPGPRTARLAWAANTTSFEISGTPASAGGLLVVPTWTGLRAYDLATGVPRWSNAAARGESSPALFNRSALVGGTDGRLHAVSLATGAEEWNVTVLASPSFAGISSSPKVYRDLAVVGAFNESGGPGAVVAVDLYAHAVRWSYPTGSVHFSSPAVAGGIVYAGIAGLFDPVNLSFQPPFGIAAIDAETGGLAFFHPTNGSVRSSPAVAEGVVVYSTVAGYLDAIDAGTGEIRWTRSIGRSVSSPAVDPEVPGGLVVVGSGTIGSEGRVWAFDLGGSPLWSLTVNGAVQASPTIAEDVVYVATNAARGTVYAIQGGGGTASVLWSYTPTPEQYILSSPVVADGRLIVGSDNGYVYAFQDAPAGGVDLTPIYVVIAIAITVGVAPIAAAAWMLRRRLRGTR